MVRRLNLSETSAIPHRWIFLRGLGRGAIHWGPFIAQFRASFAGAEIETLEMRGNGALSHSPSYLSIEENLRDLRSRSQLLKQSRADGVPIMLLAISMGAMIATEWAERYPEEIEGLVLINTSDRGSSNFYERLQPANYRLAFQMLTRKRSPFEVEKDILKITTNELPTAEADRWVKTFARAPATTTRNWLRQLAAAARYTFPEHRLRTEVLLLASQNDRLVDSICSEKIAHMWALKAHFHPKAGHDLPLEDGAWVCEEIRRWIAVSF